MATPYFINAEEQRVTAVAFATWVDENTIKSCEGHFSLIGLMPSTEYQIEDLYDYWIHQILNKNFYGTII